MSGLLRWFGAILTALLLLCAATLGLGWYATTDFYADHALGDASLTARQQAMIDAAAGELSAAFHVSPEALAPFVDGAAQKHHDALAAWLRQLWHDPEADAYLPVYLSDAEERALVEAILVDETFTAATESSLRRAVARDDVAYALDEAVCGAVLPLRRSLIDLGLTAVSEAVDLPGLSRWAGLGAIGAAGLAGILLAFIRKAAGSTLAASAGLMALASLPVWLLDIPGMLGQLNPIAASQGACALLWLALPWYGAALMLAVPGILIIRSRN